MDIYLRKGKTPFEPLKEIDNLTFKRKGKTLFKPLKEINNTTFKPLIILCILIYSIHNKYIQ